MKSISMYTFSARVRSRRLCEKAGGGAIVAIASGGGLVTPPGMGFSLYVASKMGVVELVRARANELAADNIIVSAVHLGSSTTKRHRHARRADRAGLT